MLLGSPLLALINIFHSIWFFFCAWWKSEESAHKSDESAIPPPSLIFFFLVNHKECSLLNSSNIQGGGEIGLKRQIKPFDIGEALDKCAFLNLGSFTSHCAWVSVYEVSAIKTVAAAKVGKSVFWLGACDSRFSSKSRINSARASIWNVNWLGFWIILISNFPRVTNKPACPSSFRHPTLQMLSFFQGAIPAKGSLFLGDRKRHT